MREKRKRFGNQVESLQRKGKKQPSSPLGYLKKGGKQSRNRRPRGSCRKCVTVRPLVSSLGCSVGKDNTSDWSALSGALCVLRARAEAFNRGAPAEASMW